MNWLLGFTALLPFVNPLNKFVLVITDALHGNRERDFHLKIRVINNLALTKKHIKKAERLCQAQLIETQNGMLISYRRCAFEERQKQAREEVAAMDS